MDSYLKSTSEPDRLEITQLGSYSRQFLKGNQQLFNTIEVALRPFTFQVSATHESIEIVGDDVAVKLISKLFDQISEAMNGNLPLDIPHANLTISGIVQHCLSIY